MNKRVGNRELAGQNDNSVKVPGDFIAEFLFFRASEQINFITALD